MVAGCRVPPVSERRVALGLDRTLVLAYALIFLNAMQFATMFALAPTFKDALDLSKFETGLIFAVSGLATMITAAPIGLAADRIGARPVALAGAVVVSAALVLQGLAPDLVTLLVSRIGIGAGFAAVLAAGPTWIADSVSDERRPAAVAAIIPIAGLGALVGPVVGGVLADGFGRAVPLVLFAALIAGCVGALLLSPPGGSAPHGHDPFLHTLALGRRSLIVITAVLLMLLGAVTEAVTSILGPLQLDHNGLSASAIGAILSAGSGVFVVVAFIVTRAAGRALRPGVGIVGLLLLGGIVILLASSGGTTSTSVGLILRTAVLGVIFTVCFPLAGIGAAAAGVGRGAVYAALQAAGGLANAVGPVAAGKIGESVGDWVAYAGVAGLCLAAAAWMFVASRRPGGVPGTSTACSSCSQTTARSR